MVAGALPNQSVSSGTSAVYARHHRLGTCSTNCAIRLSTERLSEFRGWADWFTSAGSSAAALWRGSSGVSLSHVSFSATDHTRLVPPESQKGSVWCDWGLFTAL